MTKLEQRKIISVCEYIILCDVIAEWCHISWFFHQVLKHSVEGSRRWGRRRKQWIRWRSRWRWRIFGCVFSRLVISMFVCAPVYAGRNFLLSSDCRCCIGSSASLHCQIFHHPQSLSTTFSHPFLSDLGIKISYQDLHIVTRNLVQDTLQLFVEIIFLVIFCCICRRIHLDYSGIEEPCLEFHSHYPVADRLPPSSDPEASPLRSTPTPLSCFSPSECSTMTPSELIVPLPVHLISLIPRICKIRNCSSPWWAVQVLRFCAKISPSVYQCRSQTLLKKGYDASESQLPETDFHCDSSC